MAATLLVIHVLLAIALIGVILIQRSTGDGGGLMGGGGGASSLGGLMSVRGTANLLTRITSFLAGGFILTSIVLTILAGTRHTAPGSITDRITPVAPASPTAPAVPEGEAPAPGADAPPAPPEPSPVAPSVPLSK